MGSTNMLATAWVVLSFSLCLAGFWLLAKAAAARRLHPVAGVLAVSVLFFVLVFMTSFVDDEIGSAPLRLKLLVAAKFGARVLVASSGIMAVIWAWTRFRKRRPRKDGR